MKDSQVAKLEAQIERDIARDRSGRAMDMSRHLRAAMDLASGELQPTGELARAAALMVEAADILAGVLGRRGA